MYSCAIRGLVLVQTDTDTDAISMALLSAYCAFCLGPVPSDYCEESERVEWLTCKGAIMQGKVILESLARDCAREPEDVV
jgi:hypothetical protein